MMYCLFDVGQVLRELLARNLEYIYVSFLRSRTLKEVVRAVVRGLGDLRNLNLNITISSISVIRLLFSVVSFVEFLKITMQSTACCELATK